MNIRSKILAVVAGLTACFAVLATPGQSGRALASTPSAAAGTGIVPANMHSYGH